MQQDQQPQLFISNRDTGTTLSELISESEKAMDLLSQTEGLEGFKIIFNKGEQQSVLELKKILDARVTALKNLQKQFL